MNLTARLFIILLGLSCFSQLVSAQEKIIDEVVAVLGDKKILYSDIQKNLLQMQESGEKTDAKTSCNILEQLLVQKLLVNQAEVDSIEITENQVENELQQRMQYFINMWGSQEKLESYWGKSIIEIKKDTREEVRDLLLIREMRRKITEGITVTPAQVRAYYKNLSKDSVPYINAEVEYNQILIYPKSSEQAIIDVREKLLEIRKRIIAGESFATLAVINSEDGSATRGGDIGWISKSDVDPEYAKAAFALKKGAVSRIVQTAFGYHLIQCIDKTDDRVHTRHIIIKPKISFEEKQIAIARMDSIIRLVRLDSLKFNEAALRFSQDEKSRISGGQAVNPRGGARWKLDEFSPKEYEIINNLKVGEISAPYETIDEKGNIVFKVIWLKNRTNPHVGNLEEDFSLFKTAAMEKLENEKVNEWVKNKAKTTYIKISGGFEKCAFSIDTWKR